MRYLILFLTLSIISCSSNEITRPIGLLQEDEFVKVTVYIHLAEAYAMEKRKNRHDADIQLERFYREIFDKFEVDKDEWLKTLNYYKEDPEEFEYVYAKINFALAQMENDWQDRHDKGLPYIDTLKLNDE